MRAFLTVSLTCFLVCTAMGQDGNSTRVGVPLLIQDSHHHPILIVTRESLTLKVDKNLISDFTVSSLDGVPLRLGILFDVSNSARDRVDYYSNEARDFAFSVAQNRDDRVFFGAFAAKTVATPWLDHDSIRKMSTELRVDGGTALYDSVLDAFGRMGKGGLEQPYPTGSHHYQ